MAHSELLQAGLSLMFSGIGFVMFFLLILIYAIQLMSHIVNRFFPEAVSELPSKTEPVSYNNFDHLRPAIVAAVVHHHRQQQSK